MSLKGLFDEITFDEATFIKTTSESKNEDN